MKIFSEKPRLLDQIRRILGVSNAEEREKGSERLCIEIIAENFPSLGKESNAHFHRGIIIGHMNVSVQKTFSNTHILKLSKVFPGGSVGKNPLAKAGTNVGLIPGLERFHKPQLLSRCCRVGALHLCNQRKPPQNKEDSGQSEIQQINK